MNYENANTLDMLKIFNSLYSGGCYNKINHLFYPIHNPFKENDWTKNVLLDENKKRLIVMMRKLENLKMRPEFLNIDKVIEEAKREIKNQ